MSFREGDFAATVVAAAPGYPGDYPTGLPLRVDAPSGAAEAATTKVGGGGLDGQEGSQVSPTNI